MWVVNLLFTQFAGESLLQQFVKEDLSGGSLALVIFAILAIIIISLFVQGLVARVLWEWE